MYFYQENEELDKITVPYNYNGISEFGFYNCSSLSDITIPSSITEIGDGAFSGCSNYNIMLFLKIAFIYNFCFKLMYAWNSEMC